jgi:glycosyltransferase involved in cell wall biosynthesis
MNDVSYIVTVYNKAKFLPGVLEAIDEELKYTGGEIVIVDDGSTDGSAGILSAFAQARADVTLITQPNAGVAAATNRGLALAAHPFTRLVDGDDRLAPGSTIALRDSLEASSYGFGYGGIQVDGQPAASATGLVAILSDPLAVMLTRQPFIPSCTLGRTSLMQQVLPLPEDVVTSQDFSLGVKLSALTKFIEIDMPCCIIPAHSGGLSASKGNMYRDTVVLSARFADEMAWPPRLRRLSLRRNAGRARNYLRRHDPTQISRIAAVSVIAALARLPFPWPFAIWMSYVASVYRPVSGRPVRQI